MRHWCFIALFLPLSVFGQIIPYGSVWKYYDLENEPADISGMDWTDIAYNDIAWASGPAHLGYGDNDEQTLINDNTLTGYFRHLWNDPGAGSYAYIRLSLVYDDGAIVYLNGSEVWRVNMPGGTVTYNTFASSTSSDNSTAQLVIASPLVDGTNTIAVEVHQRSSTSSDLSFDFQLEYIASADDALFGFQSAWKYFDLAQMPANDAEGDSWTSPVYNDMSWAMGNAQLGYGDGDEATILNGAPLTGYFRKEFTAGMSLGGLAIELLYDDGAIVYVDGIEVLRINMPAGPVLYGTFASGTSADNSLNTTIVPLNLAAGPHVVAVEVHQASSTSSDLSFDMALTGLEMVPVEIVRGPYLQRGGHDRMTVRWRTNVPTASGVRYGTVPGLLPNLSDNPALTTEHTIELTGLSAATRYYYTIEIAGQFAIEPSEEMYFKTSPMPGTISIVRSWILGDCGTGNNDARAVRDAYYDFVGEEHTDLILLLGDNAYNDGTDTEYQTAIFENMYEAKLINAQLWSCLGNHDGHTANSNAQTGPYYDIFTFPINGECGGEPSGTEAYYSFDYGNVHFIVLDSYETDRSIGSAMYDWCAFDVQNATAKWIIAVWHHPAYSKGSHNSDTESALIDMRTNFVPMLEANGVDLILSGHSHSYERSYYINGHYGLSTTFDPVLHTVGDDGDGDGRLDGDGAYHRMLSGPDASDGHVYVTAGSSGKISGGSLNHPAMYHSVNVLGSCYLEVTNNELSLSFIRTNGVVDDYFTIRKADESCTSGTPCDDGDPCTVNDMYTSECFCDGIYQTLRMVTTTADAGPGSLRELVQAACEGDTITFDPSLVTPIVMQSQIVIDTDLTIIGNASMNTLSGDNQNRIFELQTGSTLRLQDLRLAETAEDMHGGAILVKGVLEIDQVEFSNNFEDGLPRAVTNQGLVRVQGGVSTMD